MSEFQKYMHVERFGKPEVRGIENGECYVFPKLDGTNGSLWLKEDGTLGAGSRRRELGIGGPDCDNHGFYAAMMTPQGFPYAWVLREHPSWILYGEWLIPHTLKTYEDDAWRVFYVFDVWDRKGGSPKEPDGCLLHYEEYAPELQKHMVPYLQPLRILMNPTYEQLTDAVNNNVYLIKKDKGIGEGVVIKNYNFVNRFGRQVWAKLIASEFKEQHTNPYPDKPDLVEEHIVNKYVTKALVDKEKAKIEAQQGGWENKYIPRLLGVVFNCLVTEESWNFVKEHKMPTVNFRLLQSSCYAKVRELLPDVFG